MYFLSFLTCVCSCMQADNTDRASATVYHKKMSQSFMLHDFFWSDLEFVFWKKLLTTYISEKSEFVKISNDEYAFLC